MSQVFDPKNNTLVWTRNTRRKHLTPISRESVLPWMLFAFTRWAQSIKTSLGMSSTVCPCDRARQRERLAAGGCRDWWAHKSQEAGHDHLQTQPRPLRSTFYKTGVFCGICEERLEALRATCNLFFSKVSSFSGWWFLDIRLVSSQKSIVLLGHVILPAPPHVIWLTEAVNSVSPHWWLPAPWGSPADCSSSRKQRWSLAQESLQNGHVQFLCEWILMFLNVRVTGLPCVTEGTHARKRAYPHETCRIKKAHLTEDKRWWSVVKDLLPNKWQNSHSMDD